MARLLSLAEFRKEVQAKRPIAGGVFRLSTLPSETVEGEARRRRFCFSDGSVDRMGDTIDPEGWDITDFAANPVALWAHDSMQPPIGRAHDVSVKGGRLMGDIEFIPAETYAFAETVFRMVEGGFLNAVSVGFLPIEYSYVENDPDRGWGIDFKRQTLLEISLCPIPANPNALVDAKAKGIDVRPLIEWAERLLDGGGKVMVPRSELQRLRKSAKELSMAKLPPKSRTGVKADDGEGPIGDCGRDKGATCGMTDPEECAVHCSAKSADDDADEKAIKHLRRLLRLRRRADDDPSEDEVPLAHEDAIRMAHKCMRTAKAFQTEAMGHYAKALDHLDGVVDALDDNGDPDDGAPSNTDPDADANAEKAARLKRARDLKKRISA
jgi:HK97 family phage prohead protease